jgi:hypothetical protein
VNTAPLWSGEVDVKLHTGLDTGLASLTKYPEAITATRHQATTLDNWVPKARLVKLDVEGSEYHALVGGQHLFWPQGCPYVVLELNEPALRRGGSSGRLIREFMNKRGYSTFLLHGGDAFPTLLPIEVDVDATNLNFNVLFSTIDKVIEAWPSTTVIV